MLRRIHHLVGRTATRSSLSSSEYRSLHHQHQRHAKLQPHTTPTSTLKTQHKAQFHSSAGVYGKKTLQRFNLADIGEGITECEIVKWNIKAGATITAFDPLCEVQSDKASVEITSPFDGVVKEIIVQEGDIAKVGSALCVIEVEEEEGSISESAAEEAAGTPTTPTTPAPAAGSAGAPEGGAGTPTNPREELGSSAMPSPPRSERRMHPLDPNNTQRHQASAQLPSTLSLSHSHARSKAAAAATSSSSPSSSSAEQASYPQTSVSPELIFAPPAVRFFARQNGVNLGLLVPGSGKDGRIEMKDVEAFMARAAQVEVAREAAVQQQQQQTAAIQQQDGGDMVVELGRTRYGMYKAMVKSLEVPHFGYTTYLDITELHHLLPTLNANIPLHFLPPSARPKSASPSSRLVNPSALVPSPVDVALQQEMPEGSQFKRVTYLPFLLKTLSKAMHEWPLFRSSITPSSSTPSPATTATTTTNPKPTLTVRPTSDITLALSTPTGLYTPTIPSISSHSLYTLASTLSRLSHLGRQSPCGLTLKEMPKKGGTITVSNVGAIGKGVDASPVLVPGGGVAIVAIGRAEWVWDVSERYYSDEENGKKGERRLRVPVSWSADHRVVEGAELAAFVECWRGWVEKPARMIGEGI